MSLDIRVAATEEGDVKLDFMSGPVMSSILLAIDDEEPIVALLRKGFEDARSVKDGATPEEIAEKNQRLGLPASSI